MSLCKDCVTSVTHEGTPTGKIETLGGVECYIATPEGDYPKNKVILYLPDIHGLPLNNAQLLVDDYAKNGFKTVLIDYLYGDQIPQGADLATFDLKGWFVGHGSDVTRPLLDKVIAVLKESGVTDFGATGYCFGGRYVFDLAFDNIIKVGVATHPSLLKFPGDFERYITSSKAPLLINSCTIDTQFPKEIHSQVDEIFAKFEPGYKREYFEGCRHGFAVRGDLDDPKVKAGKEGAFKSAAEWFLKYL